MGVDAPDVRRAGDPHAARRPRATRCRGRSRRSTTATLCALLREQGDAEFETAKVDGRTGNVVAHRPRRPDRAADRGRARLAADARRGGATSRPTRRSRAGSRCIPHGASDDLEIWIDRAYVPAGYGWCFPAARRAADRRRLVRPALPREGHRRCGSPTDLGADADALPGQLDPAPAAAGDRGRRLLRRRLRRPLPAADRRGHPHGVLLRHRLRARAARGGRGRRRRASGARALRTRSAPRTAGSSSAMLRVQQLVPAACRRACWRRRCARCGAGAFVDWSFDHYLTIAPPAFALPAAPRPRAARRGATPPTRPSSPLSLGPSARRAFARAGRRSRARPAGRR